MLPVDSTKEQAFEIALKDEKIIEAVDGKNIVKQIYVQNKLVNFVVK